MEMECLEREAMLKAEKHVANLLHAPDKLEKVSALLKTVSRKKASVEAMLKTAMQSQLDGVRNGLDRLKKAQSDIEEVRKNMIEIQSSLSELPNLVSKLNGVSKETGIHSQLLTAKENLKHIFTVPESVRFTENLITEGRLLEAHKSLMDLENSRDDLFFELHKLPFQSTTDKNILKDYFGPVNQLSERMEKQIKFVMSRTLNIVRKDPKIVVSALRIIEREEKEDTEVLARQKSNGFLPGGRPKKWKALALEVLRFNVRERIEGNQLESRSENKMWLVRHLECIRLITLEDLRIVKSLCTPVFPPDYHILTHFINLYNEAISNRLLEIIEGGLEGQEYVTLLSWLLSTYGGTEFMRSSTLEFSPDQIRPLLDESSISELMNQYLTQLRDNYSEWMKNTLSVEVEDWKKDEEPEIDSEGHFHTSAPIIIYQMIDENLQVAASVSETLIGKVLYLSLTKIVEYGDLYRNSIHNYKTKYFKDRTGISFYTRYMIAIINNTSRFELLALELNERWNRKLGAQGSTQILTALERLYNNFRGLRLEAIGYLLDECFLDINSHFGDILSSKWMSSSDPIDTVVATLNDYFEDYNYLQKSNFDLVLEEAQERVAFHYITSLLESGPLGRRKILFDSEGKERRIAGVKIQSEALQIKNLFIRFGGDAANFDSPLDSLALLAEVLNGDRELLSLELGTLVKRYPDINHEQLFCLLYLRGDLSKSEAKDSASELLSENPQISHSTLIAPSIFSRINVKALSFLSGRETLNPFSNNKSE